VQQIVDAIGIHPQIMAIRRDSPRAGSGGGDVLKQRGFPVAAAGLELDRMTGVDGPQRVGQLTFPPEHRLRFPQLTRPRREQVGDGWPRSGSIDTSSQLISDPYGEIAVHDGTHLPPPRR